MSLQPLGAESSNAPDEPVEVSAMRAAFQRQQQAYLEDAYPNYHTRIDRLNRMKQALDKYTDKLIAAVDADFDGRLDLLTHMGDVFAPKATIKNCKKNLQRWMKPEKRRLEFPYWALGYKGEVHFQPLGVVGVIAPWNAPVALTLIPAINALAAGNRVMLKPSGQTATTEATIAEMIAEFFDPTEIAVATGRGAISRAFPTLPFNHIVFTGGPTVARDVMAAAAANLTPVTLELGGKCPVFVSRSHDIVQAAQKITGGKLVNSGQVCVSPDYAFVPEESLETFISAVKAKAQSMFPTLAGNADYTSIFGDNNLRKLQHRIEQAQAAGARVESMLGGDIAVVDGKKLSPLIVVDPSPDLEVMQEESFGPILIVKAYKSKEEVTDFVQQRPSPLVFYYFGNVKTEREELTRRIRAGNMSVNDVVLNVFVNSLPFGGVGESGMGRYYGRDGFETLSNRKGVVTEGFMNINKYIHPPFSNKYRAMVHKILKKM